MLQEDKQTIIFELGDLIEQANKLKMRLDQLYERTPQADRSPEEQSIATAQDKAYVFVRALRKAANNLGESMKQS